jgi:NADH pyrophosphatase NudC (nudix superfamily)
MIQADMPQNAHWFAGNPLCRDIPQRRNLSFLNDAIAAEGSRFMLVTSNLKVLCCKQDSYLAPFEGGNERIRWLTAQQLEGRSTTEGCLLLGGHSGHWFFAVQVPDAGQNNYFLPDQRDKFDEMGFWRSGRDALACGFSRGEVAIVGQALALANWHNKNRFSGKSGNATVAVEAGAKRQEAEGANRVYPRIDTCAIFLIVSPSGEQILLGKSARFKKQNRTGFFSCLAGFVEQAESVEEAAVREAMEEADVQVSRVALHSTQPWPIGRAGNCELMVGLFLEAKSMHAVPKDGELAAVQWFNRAEAAQMLKRAAAGQMNGGEGSGEVVPGEYAIAHHLIKAWVDGFAFSHGESALKESAGSGSWSNLLAAAVAGALAGAVVASSVYRTAARI